MLRNSRGVGEGGHFNKHFSELFHMLQKEITITCKDSLYNEYCSKLLTGNVDQIIVTGRMQKKQQPATPFTLADAMMMVKEFSERTTESHLAITATPVNHGANFVPPLAATVPTPIRQEPMDLAVANSNTRYYRCNGFEHEASDCATLDTWGNGQAFHARMGGNCSRRDCGRDSTKSCCGGLGTSARLVAGGINKVQVTVVENLCVNDAGKDWAVEQEVGGEENGQGNGNWKLWWNALLLRILLGKQKWCRIKNCGKATHAYGIQNYT